MTMFCTSLRRRPSFAPVFPSLTDPSGLNLRESSLKTHDLEIPFKSSSNEQKILRLLLLSPSRISSKALPDTLSRIQHFAALTGGVDIAIIFLLSTSAGDGDNGSEAKDPPSGLHAYAQLSSVLLTSADIPTVPILPLSTAAGLVPLVKKYMTGLVNTDMSSKSEQGQSATTLELLSMCTVVPPLSREDVFYVSDIFPSLKELADLANTTLPIDHTEIATNGSSDDSTDCLRAERRLNERLTRMIELRGEEMASGLVDFWREEWVTE